ncbi:hypothetical protein KGQ34_03625, partial [Patescibacteria group bacterium]|nr:hypothetical protein [Patescibacteria group bacterium]
MSVKKENNLYDRNEILIFDLIFITRFVVWVSVGVVVFLIWSFGFLEFNPLPFVFLIPAYLIINAILWRLSRRIVFFLPFVFFQFLLAIVMTTLIVHYSGGLESSF